MDGLNIRAILDRAEQVADLAPEARAVETAVSELTATAAALGAALSDKDRALTGYAVAWPFLESLGDVVMAWMLVWRALIAQEKLTAAEKPAAGTKARDIDFYDGQIQSARFFIGTILPVTLGKLTAVTRMCPAAVAIKNSSF